MIVTDNGQDQLSVNLSDEVCECIMDQTSQNKKRNQITNDDRAVAIMLQYLLYFLITGFDFITFYPGFWQYTVYMYFGLQITYLYVLMQFYHLASLQSLLQAFKCFRSSATAC